MALIYDADLNYVCTDQELAAYDKYAAKAKQPMKLKVWLSLRREGLI